MHIPLSILLILFMVAASPAYAAPAGTCLAQKKTLSVLDFGAKADSSTDDTAAIQAAIDAAKEGDVVLFPKGRYQTSRSLQVSKSNIALVGQEATLASLTPSDQSLHITGSHVAVVDLRFEGTGATRLINNSSAKIFSEGDSVQLIGNTIAGGASVGILIHGGDGFVIRGNHIQSTLADGIHITRGASNGMVLDNTVKETRDDMIAVVSYQKHSPRPASSNILISGNEVSGNAWGRGIAVVGGNNITIENNRISDVNEAAGILIAQEDAYNTMNTHHIVVQNNTLTNIQMPPWALGRPARHAALNIDTGASGTVMFVLFKNNTVNGSYFGGMRWRGNTCHNGAIDNHFENISGEVFTVSQTACLPTENICRGNKISGGTEASVKDCPEAGSIPATGSLHVKGDTPASTAFAWSKCLEQ